MRNLVTMIFRLVFVGIEREIYRVSYVILLRINEISRLVLKMLKKCLGQKLNGFERDVTWCNRFCAWTVGRGRVKVNFVFLNGITYFSTRR